MSRAIGMIEFKTTPAGITAADAMVKTSEVEIVEAQTVCPGKYIAIITGDLSAVKAAVDTAVTTYEDKCIDSFVLGNPHESIFPAIYGTTQVEEISALGILETYDAASIIEAADQAAKTAIVDLIEKDGITLKGREGEYKVDVSAIKDPEVGQTVFLTKEEGSTNWTLVAEEKPKKTGKGNPVLTAAQRAQFEASCA